MKLKLAILAQTYLYDKTTSINGSLVQLYNLSKGFQKNKVDVHYICTTKDKSKPKFEIIDGINFYWIQSKKGLFEWKRSMSSYKKLLQSIAPDAIYVRGRNVLQYVAGNYSIANDKIYIWGTNGDDSAEYNKNINRLRESKKSILKKIMLYPLKALEDSYINKGMRMPSHIVNQNTHQKQQTAKYLKKDSVILNSYYFINNNDEIPIRNQVLWLARWSKEKQPEIFVQMASQLKHINVDFVMAGGTDNSKTVKELRGKIDNTNIKTPGKIAYNDVNRYFSKSLVFVNTSYREGVSNTFIEAMLNGVPVLSLNSNPNHWLTEFNIGYCANGNIEDLTNTLEDLLTNREKLKRMSEEAKLFAKQQFSNNNTINSYIKLFNK